MPTPAWILGFLSTVCAMARTSPLAPQFLLAVTLATDSAMRSPWSVRRITGGVTLYLLVTVGIHLWSINLVLKAKRSGFPNHFKWGQWQSSSRIKGVDNNRQQAAFVTLQWTCTRIDTSGKLQPDKIGYTCQISFGSLSFLFPIMLYSLFWGDQIKTVQFNGRPLGSQWRGCLPWWLLLLIEADLLTTLSHSGDFFRDILLPV